MSYDKENDCFNCPNRRKLLHSYDKNINTDNGYTVTKSYYTCESWFKDQYKNRFSYLQLLLKYKTV